MHLILDAAGVLFLVLVAAWFLTWLLPVRLWTEARAAGAPVGFADMIGMRLRKVDPASVVRPLIVATKTDLGLSVMELEAHALAGGDVQRVVLALVSASKQGVPMTFQTAAAMDLAGRDPLAEVQTHLAGRDDEARPGRAVDAHEL